MNIKTILKISLVLYVVICCGLVVESGLFRNAGAVDDGPFISLANDAEVDKVQSEEPVNAAEISAVATEFFESDRSDDPVMGSADKESGYKFKLEFTRKGAAIKRAILSEYDDRDHKDPKPLAVLNPVIAGGSQICTLANGNLDIPTLQKRYALNVIDWTPSNVVTAEDGTQTVEFKVNIKADNKDAIAVIKTYTIKKDSYDVECEIKIENLLDEELAATVNVQGPTGINRESYREDGRDVVSAYKIDGNIETIKRPARDLRNSIKKSNKEKRQLNHKNIDADLLWAASTNKYFAAIVRQESSNMPNFKARDGEYYDEDINNTSKPNGNEELSLKLGWDGVVLGAAGQENSTASVMLSVFVGPKDKSMFDKHEVYKEMQYFQTINFRSCFCCPMSVIQPLAFGILGLMKGMYTIMGPFGNYGVVIMLLVFMMRLVMHPITKKSQVSMMGLQKLGPKMEEVKAKYANDPKLMQQKSAELYRDAGINPVMGVLPMFIQMPIWMALWTAVYTSLDLRGAGFLPFWITDLSAPDALIRFKAITLPLFGDIDSINLLPILMGVVMYLQQKLMPHSASTQTNPQAAQQQKMMMIMFPLMFPLMLYKGPSGVNLYIMSSIGAGVIEQAVIRKHIREKEEQESQGLVNATSKTGGKVKKKKPKPFYKN